MGHSRWSPGPSHLFPPPAFSSSADRVRSLTFWYPRPCSLLSRLCQTCDPLVIGVMREKRSMRSWDALLPPGGPQRKPTHEELRTTETPCPSSVWGDCLEGLRLPSPVSAPSPVTRHEWGATLDSKSGTFRRPQPHQPSVSHSVNGHEGDPSSWVRSTTRHGCSEPLSSDRPLRGPDLCPRSPQSPT